MFKNAALIFIACAIIGSFYFISKSPVFSAYGENFEVYLYSDSSNAKVVKVNKAAFPFITNIKGEAIRITRDTFDSKNPLEYYKAKCIFSEKVGDGVSLYCFSPIIKYKTCLNGVSINLHIHIGKDEIVLGSPLIFGSF